MKILNYTPHDVVLLIEEDGQLKVHRRIPPSGLARCLESKETFGTVEFGGIETPIYKKVFGKVEGLPEPEEGVFCIVSAIAAQASPERNDLLVPDDIVRDSGGNVIGCKAFSKI